MSLARFLRRSSDEDVRIVGPVETSYAIRRTDGEKIDGDVIDWWSVEGPDDWSPVEDLDQYGEETEYEICEVRMRPIARKTFPEDPHTDDCICREDS